MTLYIQRYCLEDIIFEKQFSKTSSNTIKVREQTQMKAYSVFIYIVQIRKLKALT